MTQTPRLFDAPAMTLLGRRERYALADAHAHIPVQWAWFGPHIPRLAMRQGFDTFGLCSDGDDAAMSYFCGVQVPPGTGAPADLLTVGVPALHYAAFVHAGPADLLSRTIVAALADWLPAAGLAVHAGPDVPDLVERYGPSFDAQTGTGEIEIWVPVNAAG